MDTLATSQDGLATSQYFSCLDTSGNAIYDPHSLEESRSEFPDLKIASSLEMNWSQGGVLQPVCQNPSCKALQSRYAAIKSIIQQTEESLGDNEIDVTYAPENSLLYAQEEKQSPIEFAKEFESDLSSSLASSGPNPFMQIAGLTGTLLKYVGLLGELASSGQKAVVSVRIYFALRHYINARKIPRQLKSIKHITHLKGDKRGVVYRQSTSTQKKKAIALKTNYTRAYALSIQHHLYWRTKMLEFIGSAIATMGLLVIFASYIVTIFEPDVAIAIYGYYIMIASAVFFCLVSAGNTLSSKYINFYEVKYANQCGKIMYQLTAQHAIQTEAFLSDSQNPNEAPLSLDDAQKIALDLETAMQNRMQYNLYYALNHLLYHLIKEQKITSSQLDNGESSILLTNTEGPIVNFLEAQCGLQPNIIIHAMRTYNQDRAQGIEMLKGLILKTKIQRH